MSMVSASGLGTLLFLIFIGPVIYLLRYLYAEYVVAHKHGEVNVIHASDGREILSSRAYIFALVGYAIGIGNVWRFPYVIASNGGAAAVVAYLICAVCVAWPLFIYELILGQYLRLTFVRAWEAIRPRWLSFGWAQFLLLFIAQSYFSMIITYTLSGSCQEPLPWTGNTTSQEYWQDTILNSFSDLHDKPGGLGPIQWKLALSLLVFWLITFFSVAFGKNILSQITYVTVTMPVVLMIILVIVTTQKPGASAGIQFYIGKFELSELGKLQVWATALGQILFSLSPGFGTAITYSSFVSHKEDVYRAGMIVCVANTAFSLLGGFAVFSIVGYLAEQEGKTVEEVATRSGTGLAFITIAEAMSFFGNAQNVMSVLFYVMLLTLGLDSSYAWTETLVSSVEETLKSKGCHFPTWRVTLALCITMFLFGLVFTTRMGNEVLDVIDMYVGTIFLLAVCFIESIIFNLDFGWKRTKYALQAATFGSKHHPKGRDMFPKFLCRFDFHVAVPVATGLLFTYQIVNVGRTPYGGYPMSLLAWGWTMLALCLVTVLLTIWRSEKSSLPSIKDDSCFKELFDSVNQATLAGSFGEKGENGKNGGQSLPNGEDSEDGKDSEDGEQPVNCPTLDP
eukprot:CAMPEP_0181078506 /NCGR_PEP_ID=MMETSP1071-20121207/1523_1 /TAXON_ID=35127 /ORGANISM="Thalassiosira sp., Strain NH16" /LENGTH=621 /DNA_ID=CAMNT_0023159827 /DNA_START=28 /DNA_END=1893 /DNA_ORIENTATION=-